MSNKSSPHGGFICEGTISHGTLRTQDLLRSFASEYERILPFNSATLVSEARDAADAMDANWDGGVAALTGSDILCELVEALEECAQREGMYFGTTEGDGSDFGFWHVDEDELLDA